MPWSSVGPCTSYFTSLLCQRSYTHSWASASRSSEMRSHQEDLCAYRARWILGISCPFGLCTHSTEDPVDPGHLLHAGKYSKDWGEVVWLGYLMAVVLCYRCYIMRFLSDLSLLSFSFHDLYNCYHSPQMLRISIICQALRNILNLKGTTWKKMDSVL